jgi:hypothetical protein
MTRFAVAALAALLLLAPAAATGAGADTSRVQLRGTVAQTLPANKLVRVDTSRVAHILRVPGSQARIHVGQRVALRGTTLRERGNGSRVLARGVVLAGSARKGSSSVSSGGSGSNDAGRLEIKGTLTSLTPPTVSSGSVSASCALTTGQTITGFTVGDFVEMKCALRLGVWMLRDLRHEDDDVANPPNDDDDDTTDTGDTDDSDDTTDDDTGDDDDDDNSGPGGGNSGHGGGDH